MGYDLKLHIFTITLRERNKPNTSFFWGDLNTILEGDDDVQKFTNLFKAYVKHFDNKFIVYKNWNKGINITENGLSFGSQNRYIIGMIEGGYTDIVSKIKDKDDVLDEGFPVTRNHVTAIPFYFILWLPKDSNKGLLIVQSISDKSVHEPLKLDFKKFIENLNEKYLVSYSEHITEKAIKKMSTGTVKQLILRKSGLSTDKAQKVFNKRYNILDNINIDIKITGFGNSTANAIKDFMLGKYPDLLELENLKEIGLDNDVEVLATFEHNNKKATAKFEKDFKIAPVYYIDANDVPLNDGNHPDEEKIKDYLLSFLEGMKKEIGLS
ncbi:hypothetical protein M1D52_07360 [Olivibacter sp. SA151]|uniref:hypothetical protein n=1 Tax=Olivibacter jilunii TaxID=985016 RepID=UPI003F167FC6